MKILVADDDRELSDILGYTLMRAGFEVVSAADGQEALALFAEAQPSLVILDWSMPQLNGLEVCEKLRAQSAVPIIMLTVHNREEEIVRAFEAGADDYVTKPFSPKQLVARIQAALRRAGNTPANLPATRDLQLNPARHEVIRPGKGTIRLTPLEFRLLHTLVTRRGQVINSDELVTVVWGHEEHVADRTLLKGLVSRVRQKIDGEDAASSLIETVAGIGYTVR
jgi:DNA-binding response OmpR family regulator